MASFFVTGFGPFAGCEDNPTQALIELLKEQVASGHIDPACHVVGTAVLECAGQSVRKWVSRLYDRRLPALADPIKPMIVLHLGVDVTGFDFKLEQQAVNEAAFRVPDQQGWRPSRQLIDTHPGLTLSSRLHTDLDVPALAVRLNRERMDRELNEVRPSLDAGRFVCNYLYYLSLLHSQLQRQDHGSPIYALFLHVPPLAHFSLEEQLQLLLDLLRAVAEQVAGEAANDSGSQGGVDWSSVGSGGGGGPQ